MRIHPLIKTVFAILIGIFVAFCVIFLAESMSTKLYPADIHDPTVEQIEEMIKKAPLFAMIIFLIGHALSSFFGSYIAARLAPDPKKFVAGISVGFVLFLGGIGLFVSIKHALWLSISTCISYLLFSFLAIYIAQRGHIFPKND